MPTITNQSKPMPVAKFTITINKFRPLGVAFPISASVVPSPENPPFITIHDKNITVKGNVPVKLIFQLPNPQRDQGFVLLGVAFAANSSSITVGLHTFPTIIIDRFPDRSEMTIANHPQDVGVQRYDYVILVQSVATGELGIIDPALVNEPDQ